MCVGGALENNSSALINVDLEVLQLIIRTLDKRYLVKTISPLKYEKGSRKMCLDAFHLLKSVVRNEHSQIFFLVLTLF